uniref:Uncharacterized protein n=1 Tax=Talaromyces marneffei PM1 TaxID=1077442 RepID=A0A093XWB3_TALMA
MAGMSIISLLTGSESINQSH